MMGLCTFRVNSNRLFKGGVCFRESTQLHQRGTKIVVGFHAGRTHSYSLFAYTNSLVRLFQLMQRYSQVVMDVGMPGCLPDDLPQKLYRFGVLASLTKKSGEQLHRIDLAGNLLKDQPAELFNLQQTADIVVGKREVQSLLNSQSG